MRKKVSQISRSLLALVKPGASITILMAVRLSSQLYNGVRGMATEEHCFVRP